MISNDDELNQSIETVNNLLQDIQNALLEMK